MGLVSRGGPPLTHDSTGRPQPNMGLQATADSLRSYVAAAIGGA